MPWNGCRWGAVALAVALAATLVPAGYAQQQRTRNIGVLPDKPLGAVTLDVRLEAMAATGRSDEGAAVRSGDTVRVGQRVLICFTASESGYVTVWSWDAEGNTPVRIYPNEFVAETAGEAGAPVDGGAETCIGDDDGFRLEVGLPAGEARLYLHYTREKDQQFDETAYPQIRSTGIRDARPYASSSLTYRVVE